MSNPLANQTLVGLPIEEVYGTAEMTMPDGTKVKKLVQRARTPDGKIIWEEVDEKLKAFDDRFVDTTTVPANWKSPTTEVLTAKPDSQRETAQTIAQGGMTRIDMRRQLILGLGDPQIIIQNGGLDDMRLKFFKAHPSTLTLLFMMAKSHGGEWTKVAELLKPVYPDIL